MPEDIRPIHETDDEIPAHLAGAEVPALAHLTGDLSLLEDGLRPDPLLFAMPQGGLTEAQQERARALALGALVRYRDTGCRPAPAPSDDAMLRIMEFAVLVTGAGVAQSWPFTLLDYWERTRAPEKGEYELRD